MDPIFAPDMLAPKLPRPNSMAVRPFHPGGATPIGALAGPSCANGFPGFLYLAFEDCLIPGSRSNRRLCPSRSNPFHPESSVPRARSLASSWRPANRIFSRASLRVSASKNSAPAPPSLHVRPRNRASFDLFPSCFHPFLFAGDRYRIRAHQSIQCLIDVSYSVTRGKHKRTLHVPAIRVVEHRLYTTVQ
jgi:hypothetical protein